ncbi:MAG: Extracellular ligand-binding receptor [Pseudonocardiales bacterium]|nr:Extracellular ligand-binding receptor [Pseudonocardiales bacterium]
MSHYKRWVPILGAACALTLGVTACSSSKKSSTDGGGSAAGSSAQASVAGNYVIGVDDVLSGPLAAYGTSFLTDVRAAVAYVNSKGGVKGHQVDLETADSAATGQNASAAAQQLISTKDVSAILGFTLSDDCAKVSAVAASRKVPIVCTSTASTLLEPVQKYVFAGNDVELQEIPGQVEFAQKDLKLGKGTTFAILDSSPLGVQLWAKQLTSTLEAAGFVSVGHETIPVTAVNGSTQISKIVSEKPQLVFAEPVASQYLPFVKALRADGNNAPIISAHNGVGYRGITSIQDANLYGVTTTEYIQSTTPDAKSTGQQMYIDGMKLIGQNTLDELNNIIGPPGFLSAMGVMEAFKSCGYPCSGEKLATAMEKVAVPFAGLVSGNYGWDSTLHSPYKQLFIYGWDPTTKTAKIIKQGIKSGALS